MAGLSNDKLVIGGWDGGTANNFIGVMSKVATYRYTLPASAVLKHYKASLPIIVTIPISEFSAWGNVQNKLISSDFKMNNRFRGINESEKLNRTNNYTSRDMSTLVLQCKNLEYLTDYSYIISDVSSQVRQVQHTRSQILWKSQKG